MSPEEQNIREQIAAGNMDHQPSGDTAKHLCNIIDRLRAENRKLAGALARTNRVMQTKKGIGGNCLAACLSSIFKVPLGSIPELAPSEVFTDAGKQNDLMREWLATMDLTYFEVNLDQRDFAWTDRCVPDTPCLIAVKSNTPEVAAKGWGHFVVGYVEQNEKGVQIFINHDPNGALRNDYFPTALGYFLPRSLAARASQHSGEGET